MKFISFLDQGRERLALLDRNLAYPLGDIHPEFPETLLACLQDWDRWLNRIRECSRTLPSAQGRPLDTLRLLAPLPNPASLRDGYAFREHAATARQNRGLRMIPEYDQFPVFYFSNPHAIFGPGPVPCGEAQLQQLDYELEAAAVISRRGRNIPAEAAETCIAGFMVFNDWSARQLQSQEMKLSLGPAKGKDFASSMGPMLVTPDELESRRCDPAEGHRGYSYLLTMRAWVNGKLSSEGNLSDMSWTFAELIERCSQGADLWPGDVIGSGCVGGGCLLELNGTRRRKDPGALEQWLQEGDVVELEVEGLGRLCNTVVREP